MIFFDVGTIIRSSGDQGLLFLFILTLGLPKRISTKDGLGMQILMSKFFFVEENEDCKPIMAEGFLDTPFKNFKYALKWAKLAKDTTLAHPLTSDQSEILVKLLGLIVNERYDITYFSRKESMDVTQIPEILRKFREDTEEDPTLYHYYMVKCLVGARTEQLCEVRLKDVALFCDNDQCQSIYLFYRKFKSTEKNENVHIFCHQIFKNRDQTERGQQFCPVSLILKQVFNF